MTRGNNPHRGAQEDYIPPRTVMLQRSPILHIPVLSTGFQRVLDGKAKLAILAFRTKTAPARIVYGVYAPEHSTRAAFEELALGHAGKLRECLVRMQHAPIFVKGTHQHRYMLIYRFQLNPIAFKGVFRRFAIGDVADHDNDRHTFAAIVQNLRDRLLAPDETSLLLQEFHGPPNDLIAPVPEYAFQGGIAIRDHARVGIYDENRIPQARENIP
jgi:hypothetical protein